MTLRRDCPSVLGKRTLAHLTLTQQAEKLAAADKIHDHVQILRIFERAPQIDEKRMADAFEHLALRIGVFDLLHADHSLLVENLDCVEARVVAGPDQVHTPERAGAEGTDEVEVS